MTFEAAMTRLEAVVMALEDGKTSLEESMKLYEEGVALVRELQLPHVRNLLDNYHLIIGNGSLDEIREAGSNLRHVHLARVLGRSLPCPGDETDWPGLWAALHDVGYDGDCSIEAYAPQEHRAEHLAEALSSMRRMAAQR